MGESGSRDDLTAVDDPVHEMTAGESWEHLRSHELGRLVTRVGEVIDVFPVNYVVDGTSLVFRTAEGSKFAELTIDNRVVFEVDDHTAADAWSVVLRGRARPLSSSDEITAADALPLRPWVPTLKRNYVRIVPDEISGRSFKRTPEPDHTDPSEPA
jgi:nitroimidazol reductase NimA-like FMN-containing flavoprotein (pyridoxamine 5'-phosphate oxidase superfamily)